MSINSVRATLNGQVYDLNYNNTSGKWEGIITAPSTSSWNQTDHKYGITIEAIDVAGNATVKDRTDPTLGSALQLRVLEKVVPTISLASPSTGARITNSKPSITFQVRDSDSGIDITSLQLKIDGGTAIGNTASGMVCTSVADGFDCTYVPVNALSDGPHTITISISDNDGNVSNLLSSTFLIDTVPPMLNISNPPEGLITNNPLITVSGTTNDTISSPVNVTVKLNGVDQGAVSVSEGLFSKSVTLTEGANTIEIKAVDAAGLVSTVTRNVIIDTVSPIISNVVITPSQVNGGQTITITVTVSN